MIILAAWISCGPDAEIALFYKPNQYVQSQSQCVSARKKQHELQITGSIL